MVKYIDTTGGVLLYFPCNLFRRGHFHAEKGAFFEGSEGAKSFGMGKILLRERENNYGR
jgi:hypothetical protein